MTDNTLPHKKVLVLHGPNLNLLGIREPDIYGVTTLDDLNKSLAQIGITNNIQVETFQSNIEGELINKVHSVVNHPCDFIIINPAGFTHTSVALRDAFLAINPPFIEVHLSNIFAREPFRHKSFFSDIAIATISGFGTRGYELALQYAIEKISS